MTPAVISQDLFDVVQNQLQVNRQKSVQVTRHEYLLRGHLRCRQCGRAYTGGIHSKVVKGKRYAKRRYRCMGKVRVHSPITRCINRNWMADNLEAMVWPTLERYLSNPELIRNELERQRSDAGQLGVFESELTQVKRHLKALYREQHQLLQWALKGFPEDQVEAENKRLNKAKETLNERKTELETQLKTSQDTAINVPKLEEYIERIQGHLSTLDYESKRLVLDMLGITVWLDNDSIEITGTIDPEVGVTKTMPAWWC